MPKAGRRRKRRQSDSAWGVRHRKHPSVPSQRILDRNEFTANVLKLFRSGLKRYADGSSELGACDNADFPCSIVPGRCVFNVPNNRFGARLLGHCKSGNESCFSITYGRSPRGPGDEGLALVYIDRDCRITRCKHPWLERVFERARRDARDAAAALVHPHLQHQQLELAHLVCAYAGMYP